MVRMLDKIRSRHAVDRNDQRHRRRQHAPGYVFQAEALGNQYAPTGRVDINVTDNHRLSGSYWWQRFTSTTDLLNNVEARFPGLSNFGTQNSYRTTGNSTLRSTLSSNVVNELRGGWQWSPNDFFSNITADHFADQDGYALASPVNNAAFITGPTPPNNPAAAQYHDLEHRQHAELAERRAQPVDGRRLRRRVQPAEQLQRRARRHARVRHRTPTRRTGCSTPRTSRRRRPTSSTRRAALYAILTGRVTSRSRHRPPGFRHRQVRLHR